MARTFNGSTDQIDTGTGIPWPTTALTWSVWWYLTAIGANSYRGLSVANTSGAGLFTRLGLNGFRGWAVYVPVTGGGGFVSVDLNPNSNLWSLNTWNTITATYDTTNGLNAYLNGVSGGTAAANGNVNFTAVKLSMGYDPGSAGRNVTGNLADTVVWSVAMTQLEVTALAKGIRPSQLRTKNLVGWWPLDGLQSPEEDISGNKNNGTLTGTTLGFGPPFNQFTPKIPGTIIPGAITASSVFISSPHALGVL